MEQIIKRPPTLEEIVFGESKDSRDPANRYYAEQLSKLDELDWLAKERYGDKK